MTDEQKKILDGLYADVKASLSEYRFGHIAGVERAAEKIGELYLPNELYELRIAALLHDITKELPKDKHIEILKENGVEITENIIRSPKTLHARTAEFESRRRYGELASEKICQALRYHTTGDEAMTLFDAVIYLADYIEDTRVFEDCVYLRNYFWSAEPQNMSIPERELHLWKTLYLSLDMTVKDIESEGGYVSGETLLARAAILKRISA